MKKIEIVYINKKELREFNQNPRKIKDPDAIKKLRKLIKEHDFQNPLQIYKEKNDTQFSILCGNHRFRAGCLEGMDDFPCIVYEGSRKEAIARVISDNKSNEWTEYEFPILKDLLSDLDDGDFDMELTGFDDDEIKGVFDFGKEDEKDDEITDYETKYNVLIECNTEKEQEKAYKLVKEKGYECRLHTL